MNAEEVQGLLLDVFYIGAVFGALSWYIVGGALRVVGDLLDERADSWLRIRNAKRRAAQATERSDGAGVARSAPDGNHGENLQTRPEVSSC